MRTLRKYASGLLSVTVIVACTPAFAGVCDRAKEGTYESNVCWLMETEFDEVTPKVLLFLVQAQTMMELYGGKDQLSESDRKALEELTVIDSLDETKCTVTYTTMGDRNTIRFNDVRPNMVVWEVIDGVVKYALRGDGFSSDGRPEVVFFSDSVTEISARYALTKLYTEYCTGLESEF